MAENSNSDTSPKKYAVLGTPIAHSRSPMLQCGFARAAGLTDFSYERIETDCESLKPTVERLIAEGYSGFNCTMPLKTDMSELADSLTDEARLLRSVNTVAIRRESKARLDCTTTDGGGIILTAKRALGESVSGKRVLLLGAGGAARSAAMSLSLAGARLTILNRTLDGAKELVRMLGCGECAELSDENLIEYSRGAELVVNCTALGMTGKPSFNSLDFLDGICSDGVVIDAVYNPLDTELLCRAREKHLAAMSGLWMLIYQGALAFEWWTGMLPDENACQAAFEAISK